MPPSLHKALSASGFMRNHVDAPHCEFSFHIAEQKPLRFLLSSQSCIHMAKRESTHE